MKCEGLESSTLLLWGIRIIVLIKYVDSVAVHLLRFRKKLFLHRAFAIDRFSLTTCLPIMDASLTNNHVFAVHSGTGVHFGSLILYYDLFLALPNY